MKGREDEVPNQTVTKQIRSQKPFCCEGDAIEASSPAPLPSPSSCRVESGKAGSSGVEVDVDVDGVTI